MQSEQFDQYGEPLTSHEHVRPEPRGTEVLIRISACGVCHSDLHIWEGYFDLGNDRKIDITAGRSLPFTLGHEIAGEIAAMGPDAEGLQNGESVVVYPWIGCGQCSLCEQGDEHLCNRPQALGTTVDGGFSEYVLVPHPRYLHGHGEVPAHVACTYACSGLTAYSAFNKLQGKADGGELLIIGAGGVGLASLAVARAMLDCRITVMDIDRAKREAALAEGADAVLDPTDREGVKAFLKSTRGGVMAAVDFVGSDKSVASAMGLLNKSATLVVVGLFGGAMSLSTAMLPMKSLTLAGSMTGSPQEMSELMALVRDGKLKPMKVATRALSCAHETLCDLRDGKVVGRIVLQP